MAKKVNEPLLNRLIKLKNLQLVGKLLSDEMLLGLHGSKRAGLGVEFEQYKHYQPGDDLKRIDWKLYARSGKHLVRESSVESHARIRFVVDLSGSMNYTENGVSRLDYARILLASLASLGYTQNDKMGLYGLSNGQIHILADISRAATSKQTFQNILVALEKVEAKGAHESQIDKIQWQSVFNQNGKELLVLVSDLLQKSNEWTDLVQSLVNPHREVVLFQILGDQELNFNLDGFHRFIDLETGQEVELNANQARSIFTDTFQSYLKQLDTTLNIPQVQLNRVSLMDDPSTVLKSFLTKRNIS